MKWANYRALGFIGLICISFGLQGCQKTYYKTMEAFGKHKRDILVDRVSDARDAQNQTREQFASALDEFNAVVNFDGGDIQQHYKKLQKAYDRCESKANAVHARIKDVKRVATALFKEWEDELDQYTNQSLRRSSQQQLDQTMVRYDKLISAMERAETKIDPVLSVFRDQVLYLRHHLNAQAIASLQNELAVIESDVADLIQEMETAIAEADAFISSIVY